MGKIKILPESVANQIAAGEVVERPASVVKELLDNAIDAQAKTIKIDIDQGGTKKIQIIDDGTGMDEQDLKNCFKRHATSKIADIEDLLQISTMGFRGEALSSIAAVSKLIIRTKPDQQSSGKELQIVGGKTEKIKPIGMPKGTSVLVEDLFFNVPVRKKFLKTINTELRHIVDVVNSQALIYPKIAFNLMHNRKQKLNYLAVENRELRIKQVFGENIHNGLLPIYFDHPHLQISGYISKPQIAYQTKYQQYLYVNHRRVSDKGVIRVVKDAYGTLLSQKVYPMFILFFELSPDMVDVNVHPRKEEVRFVNSNFVHNSLRRAVNNILEKSDLTFEKTSADFINEDNQFISKQKFGQQPQFKVQYGVFEYSKTPSLNKIKAAQVISSPVDQVSDMALPYQSIDRSFQPQVLQINNTYLVASTDDGIIIYDQHAAHERALYDKLLHQFQDKTKAKNQQSLLIPIDLGLLVNEAQILADNLNLLFRLGFEIKKLDNKKFQILRIPAILVDKNISRIIHELLADLSDEKSVKNIDDQSLRALTFLACRSAVKAGDRLSGYEAKHIIESLSATDIKYTCPHGRPVKVTISIKELEKMFKRS